MCEEIVKKMKYDAKWKYVFFKIILCDDVYSKTIYIFLKVYCQVCYISKKKL